MRAIIQRVTSASVTADDQVVSKISKGLMVLVGIGSSDTVHDASVIVKKILGLRVFDDPSDPRKVWKSSVQDIDGDILCVSQFTLLANTTKSKPDFHLAMSTEPARELYENFFQMLRAAYKPEKIQDGKFGAMMNVSLTNEGPVTFTVDSLDNPPKPLKSKKGISTNSLTLSSPLEDARISESSDIQH